MTDSADTMGAAAAPTPPVTTPTEKPFEEALKRLARGTPTALGGLLHDVESHVTVDGTLVTAHCYCLKLDGNGRARTEDLVKVIAEHVLDYAIPRSHIREAAEELQRSRSTQKLVRLTDEARSLFTDLEQSGEGGELLLFALAEKLLRLPQLICKMSLKTNTRMHVHGADGLHAGVDPTTGKLLLYWGESKIYGDVTGAVRECLASIRPMLAEYSSGQRDLQLLQRHADLDDPALEAALKKYLDPDSDERNSLEFRGLCLVGFDCDAYPAGPSTTQLAMMAKQIATTLPTWRDHLKKRIGEERLDVVDEAHKVGDRQRGVLLQDVIERIYGANPELRVVFASPMTSNPGILLADGDANLSKGSFASEDVTVTQNLFWVSQRHGKPKVWDVQLCARGSGVKLGEIGLASKPSNDSKRLSFIAHAIGGSTHGNIVYVNGAAEAEKIAGQLFDLVGADVEGDAGSELRALIDLAQHVVHKKFALATCLRRGVAFPSLDAILRSGEWTGAELKASKTALPKSVFETVAAFANTRGGWMVLGASLCSWRPLRPAELGSILGIRADNLTKRHLSEMVAEGRLRRLFPGEPTHPNQAYAAASDDDEKSPT